SADFPVSLDALGEARVFAGQEVSLVLNPADGGGGFILATSTWPRFTRFLDKFVNEGFAFLEPSPYPEAKRLGGGVKIEFGAIAVGRRRRRRAAAKNAASSSSNEPTEAVSGNSILEERTEAQAAIIERDNARRSGARSPRRALGGSSMGRTWDEDPSFP